MTYLPDWPDPDPQEQAEEMARAEAAYWRDQMAHDADALAFEEKCY